jgi:hypothetical protein
MSAHAVVRPPVHGILAEFATADAVVGAAQRVREAGYTRVDGYSPYPMEELAHALGLRRSIMPRLALAGGLLGLVGGYGLTYWTSVIEYPMNIGGRPFHSWPSFIIPTFETTILVAAFAAVFGMLALNGLPRPYHPVFNVKGFEGASQDRFFLCVESEDPRFDREGTRQFLETLGAEVVTEVEH